VRIIAGKETKAKLTSIGKAQPVVWSGCITTSNVTMKTVNHEPMISLEGTILGL